MLHAVCRWKRCVVFWIVFAFALASVLLVRGGSVRSAVGNPPPTVPAHHRVPPIAEFLQFSSDSSGVDAVESKLRRCAQRFSWPPTAIAACALLQSHRGPEPHVRTAALASPLCQQQPCALPEETVAPLASFSNQSFSTGDRAVTRRCSDIISRLYGSGAAEGDDDRLRFRVRQTPYGPQVVPIGLPECILAFDALHGRRIDGRANRLWEALRTAARLFSSASRSSNRSRPQRAPLFVFVGDSMVRQLFMRIVAALRYVGPNNPFFEQPQRSDICFTAGSDGSSTLQFISRGAEAKQQRRGGLDPQFWFGKKGSFVGGTPPSLKDVRDCGAMGGSEFAIVFLWGPQSVSPRTEWLEMEPVVALTAGFLYWERGVAQYYWQLLELDAALRLSAVSKAVALASVTNWATNAESQLGPVARAVLPFVRAAARRLSAIANGTLRSSVNHRLPPLRYIHISVPQSSGDFTNVTEEQLYPGRTPPNHDHVSTMLHLASRRAPLRRGNTRLGSIDAERVIVEEKNARLARTLQRLRASGVNAAALPLHAIEADARGLVHRADPYHFGCRLRSVLLENTTNSTTHLPYKALLNEPLPVGASVERPHGVPPSLLGYADTIRLIQLDFSKGGGIDDRAAAQLAADQHRCDDEVNYAAALVWSILVVGPTLES